MALIDSNLLLFGVLTDTEQHSSLHALQLSIFWSKPGLLVFLVPFPITAPYLRHLP